MRLISLLLLLASSQSGGDLDARADLAKTLIERRVANRWNPGIVVGLVDGDQTRVVAAGRRSADDPRPLDGQAIFEIGSVSKVFTGILLAEAVERKEVRLEQPVAELLPDAIREKFSGDKAKITLRMLSQHLSGLAQMPSNFKPKQADSAYSDLAVGSDGTMYCLYERETIDGSIFHTKFLTLARLNLEWLSQGKDALGPGAKIGSGK